jgi:ketosteroid isomerase-like protein
MSRENVELVRELQDDWNRGDTAVRRDAWHPDVEFLPLRSATEGGYHGLAGIEAFVSDTLAVFETFEMKYEYADLGDRVLAWGTIHLRARGSGLETDIETAGLFDFRDRKIVRGRTLALSKRRSKPPGLRSRRCRFG